MSTLKVNNLQDINAGNNSTPAEIANGRAKAWLHMNGTGTISIENSYNISFLTDLGLGKYQASLSITMSDTKFCVVGGSSQNDDRNDNVMGFHPYNTTKIRMYSWQTTGSSTAGEDATFVSAAVFGDLA